jgi:hypothetical protein
MPRNRPQGLGHLADGSHFQLRDGLDHGGQCVPPCGVSHHVLAGIRLAKSAEDIPVDASRRDQMRSHIPVVPVSHRAQIRYGAATVLAKAPHYVGVVEVRPAQFGIPDLAQP